MMDLTELDAKRAPAPQKHLPAPLTRVEAALHAVAVRLHESGNPELAAVLQSIAAELHNWL